MPAAVYKWRKEARAQGRCLPNDSDGGTAALSSKDKFAAVLETAAMNGAELAEYCRSRGVYPEQNAVWRRDCVQAAKRNAEFVGSNSRGIPQCNLGTGVAKGRFPLR